MLTCLLMLSACGERQAEVASAKTSDTSWPRTFDTVKGPVTLPMPPLRVVSTSVTLTGTLLAIDAPLVATAVTSPNTTVAGPEGFFRQWQQVARDRKVVPLYQGEPNAEAIVTAQPDLVVISATGGDSALKLYEQIHQIVPAIVVNYDDKSWQELAQLLGRMTGHEDGARAAIARFDARMKSVRQDIALPPQPTNAIVYYEDDSGANVWTAASAQGKLLTELGFNLAPVPESARGDTSMGKRSDIVQISGEKFADGLRGQTLLLFSADDTTTSQVKQNRFLQRNPAVASGRVYAVGFDTFRLDYYSANNFLDRIQQRFARGAGRAQ
ncbi:Fe2+-enterobactin ABC transporter substrate-binding protein [Chitiniphilus eburneus]|uniref:Fe2+-enterobactin ABC transporter substrate-binding protein n=1 Tax=Chitiniphilus eburneus TaxID=2571148 RepID=UPI0035D104E0